MEYLSRAEELKKLSQREPVVLNSPTSKGETKTENSVTIGMWEKLHS